MGRTEVRVISFPGQGVLHMVSWVAAGKMKKAFSFTPEMVGMSREAGFLGGLPNRSWPGRRGEDRVDLRSEKVGRRSRIEVRKAFSNGIKMKPGRRRWNTFGLEHVSWKEGLDLKRMMIRTGCVQ